MSPTIYELRRKAEQFDRLSKAVSDLRTRQLMVKLAAEFAQEAARLEAAAKPENANSILFRGSTSAILRLPYQTSTR